jgi:hypothetical protein
MWQHLQLTALIVLWEIDLAPTHYGVLDGQSVLPTTKAYRAGCRPQMHHVDFQQEFAHTLWQRQRPAKAKQSVCATAGVKLVAGTTCLPSWQAPGNKMCAPPAAIIIMPPPAGAEASTPNVVSISFTSSAASNKVSVFNFSTISATVPAARSGACNEGAALDNSQLCSRQPTKQA